MFVRVSKNGHYKLISRKQRVARTADFPIQRIDEIHTSLRLRNITPKSGYEVYGEAVCFRDYETGRFLKRKQAIKNLERQLV